MSENVTEEVRGALQRRGFALAHEREVITGCVTPWGLRKLSLHFENAFLWGGFCYSGLHQTNNGPYSVPVDRRELVIVSLVEAFADSGVHTNFSFTRKVSHEWVAKLSKVDVFPRLLQFATTAEVFDAIYPKGDPARSAESFWP